MARAIDFFLLVGINYLFRRWLLCIENARCCEFLGFLAVAVIRNPDRINSFVSLSLGLVLSNVGRGSRKIRSNSIQR